MSHGPFSPESNEPDGDWTERRFDLGPKPSNPFSDVPLRTPLDEGGRASIPPGPILPEPGQILLEKYEVKERLGKGGMGMVWRVRDTHLGIDRALKMILPDAAFDPETRVRFAREAKLQARMFEHPNTIRILTSGLDKHGACYLLMEYVRGKSLEKILQPGQPMPLPWVAYILEQLCDVLQFAHDNVDELTGKPGPIIHRDLKPSNLMSSEGPGGRVCLKVLDFGIAKMHGTDAQLMESLTRVGHGVGTPPYSSPEQNVGEAEPRSDIYSVGVILYECLTGFRPFSGNLRALLTATMAVSPPRFAEINPELHVPAEVEQVVMSCLAKEPADRPSSARELARMFLEACGPMTPMPTPMYATPTPTPTPGHGHGVSGVGTGSAAGGSVATQPGTPGSARSGQVGLSFPTTEGFLSEPAVKRSWSDKPVVPFPWFRIAFSALFLIGASGLCVWLSFIRADPSKGGKPPSHAEATTKTIAEPAPRYREVNGRTYSLWDEKSKTYLAKGYKPVEPVELVDSRWPRLLQREADGVTFIRMPAGSCKLGTKRNDPDDNSDNFPPFEYRSPGFYIQECEVTNREMDAFALSYPDAARNPARSEPLRDWRKEYDQILQPLDGGGVGPETAARHPAVMIPWSVADSFARTYHAYLPTEAQWEYAARSGKSGARLVWSDEQDNNPGTSSTLAVIDQDADRVPPTHAIGTIETDKTLLGVRDMIGNVREWCRDERRPYRFDGKAAEPVEVTDKSPPETEVAVRGGYFRSGLESRYVSYRGAGYRLSDEPKKYVGFRLVLEDADGPGEPR